MTWTDQTAWIPHLERGRLSTLCPWGFPCCKRGRLRHTETLRLAEPGLKLCPVLSLLFSLILIPQSLTRLFLSTVHSSDPGGHGGVTDNGVSSAKQDEELDNNKTAGL